MCPVSVDLGRDAKDSRLGVVQQSWHIRNGRILVSFSSTSFLLDNGLKSSTWSDIAFFFSKNPSCISFLKVSIAKVLVRDSLRSANLGISKYFKAAS